MDSVYLAQNFWPRWVRLYRIEVRLLEKAKKNSEASSLYQKILESRPNDKASLMNFSFFQIHHQENFSRGKRFLGKAFSLPGRISDETLARGYLAQATVQAGEENFNQALDKAKKERKERRI